MGWFAQRRARKDQEAFQAHMATWNEEDAHLKELVDQAKTFEGEESVEGNVVQLKHDERVFMIAQNCPLVEPRRGPGHYQGGYQGISIPIGDTGIRYRVGRGRGTMVPGTEQPTVIDTGVATITDQRVVFQGPMQTREWSFAKLIGYENFDEPHWTALHVSNRQKTSGIAYDQANALDVQFRLELALAHFNNRVDQFVQQLEAEVASHQATRPSDPSLPGAAPRPS
jgi:hypothetical protein